MQIRRDLYLQRLIERKHNGLVKIVTGLRRCGKSYLLNELFVQHLLETGVRRDQIITLTMEGLENRRFRDPEQAYQHICAQLTDPTAMHYVIIDEVQMMDDFVEVLASLLHKGNVDLYVTGSNSRFLASDIATEFRGRGDVVRLHPLRFSEFATAYADRLEAWDDYLVYGGMPQILSYTTNQAKQEYLANLFAATYTRDLMERNGIRREAPLEDLLNVLASGIGSLTNPTKIERTFASAAHQSLSHTTIERYIGGLEESYLVARAKRYDVKGRRYIGSPYKIYFEDVGLRNARLEFRQTEESHLMENILFNDLRARGFSVDVGVVEGFSRSEDGKTVRSGLEIDFVVNRGSERFYIQSALRMDSDSKIAQEKASLRRIPDSFKKLIVVGGYMKPRIDEDGIVRVGVINFLLDDSLLR